MNVRILRTTPLLAVRGDMAPPTDTPHTHDTLSALLHQPATQITDALSLLDGVSNSCLLHRLVTYLEIQQSALVVLAPAAQTIRRIHCADDGLIIVVPTQIPSFAHIARTRPLPPHEQQRRTALLNHIHLATCIALAFDYGTLSHTLVANHLGMPSAAATTLLKSLAPLFYPIAHPPKHFVYDVIAHRAIMSYHHEATLVDTVDDPRQHLPEIVRRYSNHHGKIHQLPVRMSDRTEVLHYLAQQLPPQSMTEPQINAEILRHVAFDDYATARRDMVDLGFVMRTADGRVYQRMVNVSN